MRFSRPSYQAIVLILLVMGGCGRKQRNIFSFQPEEASPKISAFDCPAPRGTKIRTTKNGRLITWFPLKSSKMQKEMFVGYNVYRLNSGGLIPKKPLNQFPLPHLFFIDQERSRMGQTSFYLVRAVLKVNRKLIEGLVGQVKAE